MKKKSAEAIPYPLNKNYVKKQSYPYLNVYDPMNYLIYTDAMWAEKVYWHLLK